MRLHVQTACLLVFFPFVSSLSGRDIDLKEPSAKLRRFASDVIFEVEAGDREKYSKRLPEAIMVEFHGEPGPRPVAGKHLDELCQIAGVKRVASTVSEQSPAKIGIYFGPQEELARIARELNPKITVERGYSYWKWWDGNRTINRAVVFIATDKQSGVALEDRLIEQLLAVFGFPSKSNELDESCLSSKEQVMTSLQPVDKALLGFYYRAVPAGTKPREFDKIFREEWVKQP